MCTKDTVLPRIISSNMRILFKLSLLIIALFPHSTISNIVIACTCSDGVLIGCDSLSVSGTLVGNRLAESVFLLGTNTVVCCASGQSDFQHLMSDLNSFVRSAKLYDGGIPNAASIARYARKLVNQKYRKAHLIIAGSDEFSAISLDGNRVDDGSKIGASERDTSTVVTNDSTTGAETSLNDVKIRRKYDGKGSSYNVHEILSGGTLVSQSFALAGSGSDCVLTLMEELFSQDLNTGGDFLENEIFSSSSLSTEDFWVKNKSPFSPVTFRSMQSSLLPMKKVLRAALRADPKTGSTLRVWGLDHNGLRQL